MRHRRWTSLALVSLLALGGASATAQAQRPPTRSEAAGVARAAHVPARCLKIRVSTVNSAYASAYRRNLKASCRRWQGDGVAVFKHGRRWRFVTAGSAFECPVPKVPRAVVRDLRIHCYHAM